MTTEKPNQPVIVDLMGALKRSLGLHPNAEPAPACFCGGRAVLGPIPQDGSDAEVQFVHATGCPKDVGPGSAWQLEAEENGRRLAEPAPAPQMWDNTTVCFGSDCPNCEREKSARPAPTRAEAPEPASVTPATAGESAFTAMNAVFEAVMRAIRGEPLSDFDLSHGAVYEAQMLREANNAHARITADLDDEVIDLMNRLARAEARVRELSDMLVEASCMNALTDGDHICVCGTGRPCVEASAILAARKSEPAKAEEESK